MVSVIIPNYNHGPFLKQRIDSVLQQTYADLEVIILDDRSTDDGHCASGNSVDRGDRRHTGISVGQVEPGHGECSSWRLLSKGVCCT